MEKLQLAGLQLSREIISWRHGIPNEDFSETPQTPQHFGIFRGLMGGEGRAQLDTQNAESRECHG